MQSFDPVNESIIPPELTGPVPRRVRFDPVTLVFPVVMVIIFSGLPTYLLLTQISHQNKLHQNSSETIGQIEDAWYAGRSDTPTVSYTFSANGTSFTGKASVPDQIFQSLHRGDSLAIHYVPSEPSISHPAAWDWSSPVWVQYVLPFLGLPFVIIYWVTLCSQRRLAIGGIATVGTVTDCHSGRGGIFVNYEFDTPEGIGFQGKGPSSVWKASGTRICILYMPEKPLRNGTYPFVAYRIPPPGEF